MAIQITARFTYSSDQPVDVLLQFEAADIPEQGVIGTTTLPPSLHTARVAAEDAIGERIWLRTQGACQVEYSAKVEVNRTLADIASLSALDPHLLPGEAIKYLFDSRYCPAERFRPFVDAEFGELKGGARIAALRQWIADHFTYEAGSSTAETTAMDSFVERRGVCRDYAHVLVTLARACTIPARYCSVYDPGVQPPDFHAVAEVFLADPSTPGAGAWHMIDATGMADPARTAKVGVGRDAADVSFMTSFGQVDFGGMEVTVQECGDTFPCDEP
jgi:transglutaminase-like putative cysteine protease